MRGTIWKLAVGSTAVLAVAGAARGGHTAATALGKAPQLCSEKVGPPCLEKGGGGETMISPHIVRVGQTFTVRLESVDGEYGGVYEWSDPAPAGGKLIRCTGKTVAKKGDKYTRGTGLGGARVCTFKAVEPTNGWQIVRINYTVRYGSLGAHDDDALAIVGKGVYYISGEIRSKPFPGTPSKGAPIQDMTVGVFGARSSGGGRTFSKRVKTNNAGFWEVQVPKTGSYEVLPYLRDRDRKVKPRPELRPSARNVRVRETEEAEANFTLDRSLGISLEFQNAAGRKIEKAKANGLESGKILIETTGPNDEPRSLALRLTVNGLSRTGAPRAKVCAGSTRLWPSGSEWDARVDQDQRTGADGKFLADVDFGTEPGTFTVTASVPDMPRLFDRGELELSADRPAAITPAALAKALWEAMTNRASNGYSIAPEAAPFLTPNSTDAATESRNLTKYLSDIRGQLDGIEFAPIQTKAGGKPVYAVAFWSSGRIVQARNATLDLPAGALVLPTAHLSDLIVLGERVGSIVKGYTVKSIPRAESLNHQGPIRVADGLPFGVYGGGPYLAGAAGCRFVG